LLNLAVIDKHQETVALECPERVLALTLSINVSLLRLVIAIKKCLFRCGGEEVIPRWARSAFSFFGNLMYIALNKLSSRQVKGWN